MAKISERTPLSEMENEFFDHLIEHRARYPEYDRQVSSIMALQDEWTRRHNHDQLGAMREAEHLAILQAHFNQFEELLFNIAADGPGLVETLKEQAEIVNLLSRFHVAPLEAEEITKLNGLAAKYGIEDPRSDSHQSKVVALQMCARTNIQLAVLYGAAQSEAHAIISHIPLVLNETHTDGESEGETVHTLLQLFDANIVERLAPEKATRSITWLRNAYDNDEYPFDYIKSVTRELEGRLTRLSKVKPTPIDNNEIDDQITLNTDLTERAVCEAYLQWKEQERRKDVPEVAVETITVEEGLRRRIFAMEAAGGDPEVIGALRTALEAMEKLLVTQAREAAAAEQPPETAPPSVMNAWSKLRSNVRPEAAAQIDAEPRLICLVVGIHYTQPRHSMNQLCGWLEQRIRNGSDAVDAEAPPETNSGGLFGIPISRGAVRGHLSSLATVCDAPADGDAQSLLSTLPAHIFISQNGAGKKNGKKV